MTSRILLALAISPVAVLAATRVDLTCDRSVPAIAFSATEIERTAAMAPASAPLFVSLEIDPAGAGDPQAYRIERTGADRLRIVGSGVAGAMYGGLDVAEAARLGTTATLKDGPRSPHIAQRGIKFNIPLDLHTPSYTDCSDSAQANIPEMWNREFWQTYLDELARHRYNVLSLWSLHPFPSLVKVPEFPEVALDDVWRTRVKLGHGSSCHACRPRGREAYQHLREDRILAVGHEVRRQPRDSDLHFHLEHLHFG